MPAVSKSLSNEEWSFRAETLICKFFGLVEARYREAKRDDGLTDFLVVIFEIAHNGRYEDNLAVTVVERGDIGRAMSLPISFAEDPPGTMTLIYVAIPGHDAKEFEHLHVSRRAAPAF